MTTPWGFVSDLIRERPEEEHEAERSSFLMIDVEKQSIAGLFPFHTSLGMRLGSTGICLQVSSKILMPVTSTV